MTNINKGLRQLIVVCLVVVKGERDREIESKSECIDKNQ